MWKDIRVKMLDIHSLLKILHTPRFMSMMEAEIKKSSSKAEVLNQTHHILL